MTDKKVKIKKIVFDPQCFADFEGTQEELDDLVKEITRMAESGELFEKSVPIEDLSDEEIENLNELLGGNGNTDFGHTLQ